ncbi:MAG: phosphoribosylglycinamide formyltransferase [Muribaculaceae bacterium]|nr:phosphoribosylglycinamide formyltransferase [Muribaculaceae bacterium]
MKKIAIFASGNGSNAENIINYFQNHPDEGEVALVVCNRREAGVYDRAARLGVPCVHVQKREINEASIILPLLKKYEVEFIVLAGFLLMIPDFLIQAYKRRMINVHPSLLPKYGGKGMHGHYVHEAVVAAKEKESGITIHYVSEVCDEGEVIFQVKTDISPTDTPKIVEEKIHALEKEYFPKVVSSLLKTL